MLESVLEATERWRNGAGMEKYCIYLFYNENSMDLNAAVAIDSC